MDTAAFIESVTGPRGKYCMFAVRGTDKKLIQKFYDTSSALVEASSSYDEKDFDVYFALGKFATDANRNADSVEQMRSLFLDLDCGPDKGDKGFPNQQSALAAMRTFCRQYQLPRPTLVNSGRGIHVYWPLHEAISREQWQPVAEKLKRLCLNHPLPIDPVVPADAARVLRIPGTHNFKDSPPKEVRVLGELSKAVDLDEFEAALDHYVSEEDLRVFPTSKPAMRDPIMDALVGNMTSRFRTILEKSVAGKGCAQLLYCVNNQATVEEPLWRGALSIAIQCVDGEKAIHNISKKHPDYDYDETVRKAQLTKGPYLCESFDSINPGGCEGCPHFGKVKSPIQLGKETLRAEGADNIVFDKPEKVAAAQLQQYVIPKYPDPYFRGKNGGVYVSTENKEGDMVELQVYQHDLYVVRRVNDPETGEGIIMRLHLPYDGVREFIVPLTAVTSREEFRGYLSRHGVAVAEVRQIMDYTLKWVNNLAYVSAADASRRQFGWIDSEFTSFALGRAMIYKDRIELNAPSRSTAGVFPIFEPKGTLEGWKNTINFFNRPGFEPYQYMVGTAFGSVLTAMTPINGSIFHFYSKGSGYGKTSALFAAASVWGCPDTYVKYERDTVNDKMLRAEVLKDLPLMLDEMTNVSPKDASDVIYQIPSGLQRGRMAQSANAERWRGEPWKLICVTTGNTSLIERVSAYKDAPYAEMQRVLECRAEKMSFTSKEETDRFSDALKENYGHAGVLYLQYVMNNREHVLETLQQVQRELDTKAGMEAENRFWSAQAATVITGLLIAKRLKLVDFDIKAFMEWVVNLLKNYKGADAIIPEDPLAVMAEYYYDHYNSFLRIRGTDDLRKADSGLDHLIVPEAAPRMDLLGRYETDANVLYLLPKPFKAWCIDKQINYGWVIDALKKGPGKARMCSKRLGKGTKVSLPAVNVLRLDGSGWLDIESEDDETA